MNSLASVKTIKHAHAEQILALSLGPEENKFATGGRDNVVKIWDFWRSDVAETILTGSFCLLVRLKVARSYGQHLRHGLASASQLNCNRQL